MSLSLLGALLLSALPLGSVVVKIAVKPSYFASQGSNGFARRLALPSSALREPSGVIIALEGELFAKEKFDPATDEVPVKIENGGFSTALIGGMVGTKLNLENTTEKGLSFAGAPFLKDLAAKATKSISLDTPGVYTLTEPSLPNATLTIVVTANPYIVALDETGQILLEGLTPGPYLLKVYTRHHMYSAPLTIKENEQTELVFPLQSAKASEAKPEAPVKP